MTGIVGPNGCGKSNLVEALRWVMGETSAKRMRGSEMDDVIFAGTANRPARNIAEVQLFLDNADRKVPAQFNEYEELTVSRKIERGEGSAYRVNGLDTRAKDVQLLFADSATGAHSTALVSQGRIGAIIAAKPTDRRALLEEAAGITGLHSRRHEAELRLKAAEANLARLDDVIVTLESQLAVLKKQARQASRYRNLQDHIRRQEAILFHLLWTDAEARLKSAEEALTAVRGPGRLAHLLRRGRRDPAGRSGIHPARPAPGGSGSGRRAAAPHHRARAARPGRGAGHAAARSRRPPAVRHRRRYRARNRSRRRRGRGASRPHQRGPRAGRHRRARIRDRRGGRARRRAGRRRCRRDRDRVRHPDAERRRRRGAPVRPVAPPR